MKIIRAHSGSRRRSRDGSRRRGRRHGLGSGYGRGLLGRRAWRCRHNRDQYNPPYGSNGRSQLAADFISHALKLEARRVIMLLGVDFDSAKTRTDLFRDCPQLSRKIVLIDRIKWFDGPSSPSDNHALSFGAVRMAGSRGSVTPPGRME
jgi:hypothetical protein